ncbi:MAG: T9SS type A sorting domain-containing protein [Bacteroidetes bacterium]|nr:T9SS type A sorting domain-containing protein [Bacteroidota bacterium]MCW5895996.1 T9SS type A sorting domain-containing protein [Bacteroidota bacterium]
MRVVITNVVVTSYVSFASCTFAFVDSLGNMMSDYDASRWYTCRSHRDSSSTFSLPPIGAHIDSIVGYILPSGGSEAPRGFRIAPVRKNTLVWNEVRSSAATPIAHALHQNYPNPFNPTTNIEFRIPARPTGGANREFVSLKVFDVLGREVATLVNEVKEAGEHSIQFNASNLSSGIYFYRLKAGNSVSTKKMIYLE